MSKFLYDNYVLDLSRRIQARLDDISAEFNFDYGDEFELALCNLLRAFLPNRFGICRGFVVSKEGEKAGDDIVIYDQERFPTLKQIVKGDWSRKEKIPIEAVYAYVEAKHTIDLNLTESSNLSKAIRQIRAVKRLVQRRSQYELNKNDPYHSDSKSIAPPPGVYPSRNPVFALIVSRNVSDGDDRPPSDGRVHTLANAFIQAEVPDETYPEGIVVGGSNYLCASYRSESVHASRFLIPGLNNLYQRIEQDNAALAIAFVHLYSAIDWIRLNTMPWEDIFNDAKNHSA